MIEEVYGDNAEKITRFATKKEPEVFDRSHLKRLAAGLPAHAGDAYELRAIDRALYRQIMTHEWSVDLCSQFRDYEEYERRGLGFAVLSGGQVVSGASSYTVYRGGIEIETDTRDRFRSRGLATVCCARLILECLDRNLYPSWDAHNLVSLSLAQKLGYHFDKEYIAYQVTENYGPQKTVQTRSDPDSE